MLKKLETVWTAHSELLEVIQQILTSVLQSSAGSAPSVHHLDWMPLRPYFIASQCNELPPACILTTPDGGDRIDPV